MRCIDRIVLACGMGNNNTNTDIQVGDWIINTLCNLQPELISLIKQQEQKGVNTDRLYDSLKGDIQASFTVLSEHIGNNESKYGKLFGKLSSNKLSRDTATAVSALLLIAIDYIRRSTQTRAR